MKEFCDKNDKALDSFENFYQEPFKNSKRKTRSIMIEFKKTKFKSVKKENDFTDSARGETGNAKRNKRNL